VCSSDLAKLSNTPASSGKAIAEHGNAPVVHGNAFATLGEAFAGLGNALANLGDLLATNGNPPNVSIATTRGLKWLPPQGTLNPINRTA
jgi:hypothetical protein